MSNHDLDFLPGVIPLCQRGEVAMRQFSSSNTNVDATETDPCDMITNAQELRFVNVSFANGSGGRITKIVLADLGHGFNTGTNYDCTAAAFGIGSKFGDSVPNFQADGFAEELTAANVDIDCVILQ